MLTQQYNIFWLKCVTEWLVYLFMTTQGFSFVVLQAKSDEYTFV